MVAIEFEQLSFYPELSKDNCVLESVNIESPSTPAAISTRLLESFDIASIPFLNCDYDTIYPTIASVVPDEKISFDENEGLEVIIACEIVCAAICHQMNWDFLRAAVWKKTKHSSKWIAAEALSKITTNEIEQMLSGYNRSERIRAEERAGILRQVGRLAIQHGGFSALFFKSNGVLAPEAQIRKAFLDCPVFSQDPEEKKFQLLLQKLSNYKPLSQLAIFCKPAIDYHLIRCFLRRGLIYWKNEFGKEYLRSVQTDRKESTVGALRSRCSDIVCELSEYTGLSISKINQIEWNIGRSVCIEGHPDCFLEREDSDWLHDKFKRCPFYNTCCATQFNSALLSIDEPRYTGRSY